MSIGCSNLDHRRVCPASLVPVDPLRHQPLVAETLVRHSAAFDAGEALGKSDLLRCRAAILRARVFVDSYATTISHIGEIKTPIDAGVISQADIVADYYEPEKFIRISDNDITLFKNGGGAHLDLMTARYVLDQWSGGTEPSG